LPSPGVSAVSATDAWAVGTSDQAYVIRWDGSQWTQVTSPGDAATVLTSISAASDSDVWAAGQDTDREQQLLEHWDGSSWTRVPTLSSIFTNGLHAVTVSAGVGWVAGSDDGGAFAAPILAVPDVAQNTAAKATAAIQAAALRADNTAATSNCGLASNGLVVGTSPAAGQVLPFGSQVTLNICHPNVTVPDVFGDTPAAAQTALQNASLTFSGTTVTNSCGPDDGGLVVGTDPPSGRPVPIGTAVTLTVCNTTAVVPWVLTFDDTSAQNSITAAGLRVGSVTLVPDCAVSPGDVVLQSPLGDHTVQRGSSVDLNESNGRQPNGKPCTRE
jgi:beta-lactam-binding protein with PASTA domain